MNKSKNRIIMIVVFAMLLQIGLPIASNIALAEEGVLGKVEEQTDNIVTEESDADDYSDPTESAESEDAAAPAEPEEGEELEEPTPPVESEESEKSEEPTPPVEPDKAIEEDNQGLELPGIEDILDPLGLVSILTLVQKDLGNIFSFKFMKINDTSIKDGDIIDIDDGTIVALEFDWDTEGKDAKAGDFATIQLPEIFKKVDINSQPIIVFDSGNNSVTVGEYSITDGELRFVFNAGIEGSQVQEGFVGLNLKFDLDEFKENVEQVIKFNDVKNVTLNVIARPTVTPTAITKLGEADSKQDAKEITWSIDIVNNGDTTISDVIVGDNIPAGLKLKDGSFTITELTIGYNGSKYEVKDSKKGTIPTLTDGGFELEFDEIDPYKGFRLEYTTTITDYVKTSFSNNAYFDYTGLEKILTAVSTVSALTRSNHIEKDVKYLGNDVIEWSIDVNKSGSIINNAIVEDPLPDELKLVAGSIEVYKITKNGNDWGINGAKLEGYSSEFPITLGPVGADAAYRIKFRTTIDYSKMNGGIYQKVNEFTNKTELKDGVTKIGEADKKVTVTRKDILRKTGAPSVDYDTKTLTWTIHVNEANQNITSAVVEDILPKGLNIVKSDIKIYDAAGNEITLESSKITIEPYADDKTKISIDLGNINKEYRKIVYTTTIVDFIINDFKNLASLTGTGVGVGGITVPPVSVKPPANSFSKSHTDIDYDKKEMTWELTVNPIREPITELQIVDTFPNKGMILLPTTLVVKQGDTELVLGTDYTLAPNSEVEGAEVITGYHKGFILTFLGGAEGSLPLNALTTITYKTSYDPQVEVHGDFLDSNTDTKENKTYKNLAKFIGKTASDEKEFSVEKPAQKQVIDSSWNSGKKLGKLISIDDEKNVKTGWVSGNERRIEWEIYINYLKQNLGTDVVVKDILDYGGEIDLDSIVVKKYTVETNGNTEIDKAATPLTKGTDYTVVYGEDTEGNEVKKSFTLTFDKNFVVNERYVIIFTTSVPNISAGTYTNTATAEVGNNQYPYEGSVSYAKHNDFLDKGSDKSGDVYTGNKIKWSVKVNESLSVIENAGIVDTMSSGLIYVLDSLNVYKLVGKLTDGVKESLMEGDEGDYTLVQGTTETGETTLTIDFKEEVDYTVIIEYETVVKATSGEVNNKVEFTGENIETKEKTSQGLSASQFSYIGGIINSALGMVKITKVDSEEEITITNNEAIFNLYYELYGNRIDVASNLTTTNGVLEVRNLPLRTYFIEEVAAPTGYVINEEPIKIEVAHPLGDESEGLVKIEVENTKIKTEVTGKKVWENGPKPTIELQLFRQIGDEEKEAHQGPITLNGNESTPWTHTWTNLDKTDIDGNEYKYTVDEVDTPANYKKTISEDGLAVTNTYTSPKIEVTGTKVWVNGPKPAIDLQLKRNGEAYRDPVRLEAGTTNYTWTNLDKTDITGTDYKYTVNEVKTPNYYGKSISDDGRTITNTYESPKTDIIGNKVWENGEFNRPDSIQLQLYRESKDVAKEVVGSPVTLLKGIYEYNWKAQDINDINGNPYTYTVEEIGVPDNYTKVEDGLTVTNTYVISKTSIIGTKIWVGGPSAKPTIKLQLYRDGEVYLDPVELLDGTTEYIWEDLDETDIEGNEYVYTIDEVEVPRRYRKTILEDGLTIRNRYNPPSDPKDPEEPEEPEKPINPEEPEIPTVPTVPEIPKEPEVPPTPPEPYKPGRPITPEEYEEIYGEIPETGPTLPKTGTSDNMVIEVLGFSLLILGVFLRKKREE